MFKLKDNKNKIKEIKCTPSSVFRYGFPGERGSGEMGSYVYVACITNRITGKKNNQPRIAELEGALRNVIIFRDADSVMRAGELLKCQQ